MRSLSKKFIDDLKVGKLSALLKMVKTDDTLSLEIRKNYINIYYRGGSVLKLAELKGRYIFSFNTKYCINSNGLWQPVGFAHISCAQEYNELLPFIKREMDNWFTYHPKAEREFQQQIQRENNRSPISEDTDYFICDIEYAITENKSRFDMTGIQWFSTSTARKNLSSPRLALFEVKYGDGAMTRSSGILKHFQDIERFHLSGKLTMLMDEVESQFNQKVELGLLGKMCRQISLNRELKPEFILIFANHKPASTIMKRELQNALNAHPNINDRIDVKIAQSSLMGSGLYANYIVPLDDYLKEC